MKYLLQLSIIGLVTLVSEFISWIVPLPVPAGIYGLILMFLLLLFKVVKLEWVENTADFLLAVMPIMFVPAAASLMTEWDLIKDDAIGLLVTSVVSTAVVMAVSGVITQAVIRKRSRSHGAGQALQKGDDPQGGR